MISIPPLNAVWALSVSQSLAAVAVLIASAEYLARPAVLADTGLSSWQVAQLDRRWLSGKFCNATLGQLLRYPTVKSLIAVRLAAAALLVSSIVDGQSGQLFLTGVVVLVTAAIILRSQYGHDGADQMMMIVFIAFFIAHATGARNAVLWFIVGQSCLAYLTAGVAKASSPAWRNGQALTGILRAKTYGNKAVYSVLRSNPWIAGAACLAVILFECLLPLAVLGIPEITLLLIVSGVTFHLLNAIIMRLNTFFWSFVATYPALVYCSSVSYERLWS